MNKCISWSKAAVETTSEMRLPPLIIVFGNPSSNELIPWNKLSVNWKINGNASFNQHYSTVEKISWGPIFEATFNLY